MSAPPKRFVDHVMLWIRWRWFLVKIAFAAAVLTFIIASLIPKTYRASGVVLPPFEGGSALPFLSGVSVDLFGVNEVPASGLATLLKTRALKDRVQKRIDLMAHYEKDDIEKAYEAFEEHMELELESEESFGAVTIIALNLHILDHDPQFCADLLHVVVEEWDGLCIELNRRGAGLRRQFIEENLQQTIADLTAKEDSLRTFQEKHGIAQLSAQVEGTIASGVALEQKVAEARIAFEVLQQLYQPNHPLLQRAKLQLGGLLQERDKLEKSETSDGLLLPIGGAPELSMNYLRLLRQANMLQGVYEVMVQQYEQARIQELKDTPILRIVDRGEVPLYKYRPRRLLLSLMAALSALFLALLLVYFYDYQERARGTEEYRWFEEAGAHLSSDWKRVLRGLRLVKKSPPDA